MIDVVTGIVLAALGSMATLQLWTIYQIAQIKQALLGCGIHLAEGGVS